MLAPALAALALASASGPAGLSAAAAAPQVQLRTLAGERIVPSAIRLDRDAFELRTDAGERRVPVAEVILLEVAGHLQDEPAPAAAPPAGETAGGADVVVRLVDGSSFAGRLVKGREDVIALRQPDLGLLEVPLDLVRGLAFGPAEGRREPPAKEPAGDALMDEVARSGAAEGDVLRGTVTRVDADGVTVESDLGPVTLAPADVATVRLATEAPEEAAGPRVTVELARGGSVKGALRALDGGSLTFDGLLGEGRALAFENVARVRLAGEGFAYLSDLEPARVEQTPYLGSLPAADGAAPAAAGDDAFLFPWRRDRSVTGRPLIVAGRRFGKGLGLHSRTRLEWALDGGWARLDASAGVADEVLELSTRGALIVRVQVDGETRYESPLLRAGMPAVDLPAIDLRGARTLAVEVDFGEDADIGDRAVIGDPLLLRA